jgi:hypothetical protein
MRGLVVGATAPILPWLLIVLMLHACQYTVDQINNFAEYIHGEKQQSVQVIDKTEEKKVHEE